MMNRILTAFWIALFPFVVSAQPPEEAPAEEAEAAQEEVIPVAEPELTTAAPAPEERTVKGVTVSPSVGVYPIGYDSVNVSGPEGGRYFFDLRPSIDISSAFKTSGGKVIDFNIGYIFDWREYYNKETTDRDFSNEVYGSVSIPWTPRISTTLPAYFNYFYKAGEDTSLDNAIFVDTNPHMTIKAMDQLSFKVGMYMYFLDAIDWKLTPGEQNTFSDVPSDIDDLRRGSLASDASGFDNFDNPQPFGLFPTVGAVSQNTETTSVFINWYAANLGVSYTPIEGTSLGFDYKGIFAAFSNLDETEYLGHLLTPSISQAMPWKGGGVALKNELRIRNYVHAKVANTNTARNNYRNRTTFAIKQTLTSFMTAEFLYRIQLLGENRDDYDEINDDHWFYTGVSFSF